MKQINNDLNNYYRYNSKIKSNNMVSSACPTNQTNYYQQYNNYSYQEQYPEQYPEQYQVYYLMEYSNQQYPIENQITICEN